MNRFALLGGIGITSLVAASAIGAAHPTLTASPATVRRGATVTFSGGPCSKRDTVFLLSKLFPGHAYGIGDVTTKAGANGRFSRTFAVPTTAGDGTYSVTARCGGGDLGVVAHVRVQGGTFVTLKAAPTVVRRGGTITISGGTCASGSNAILLSKLFPGHAYGVGSITARAGANGRFSRTYVVPRSTAPGSYTITARCGGGTLGVVARVRVG